MTSLMAAALEYAQRGWVVFPLHGIVNGHCTCGREDCSSPGKHPLVRRGLHEATTDPAQIRTWWGQWENANIGITTGSRSGIVVIDIDLGHRTNTSFGSPGEGNQGQDQRPKDVWESLEALIPKLPPTLTVTTGGGGLHLIYRRASRPLRCTSARGVSDLGRSSSVGCDLDRRKGEDQERETRSLRSTTGRLPGIHGALPGVDLRADGGYIVAPPSLHASGERYRWLTTHVDVDDPDGRYESDETEEHDESDLRRLRHDVSLMADLPSWIREAPRPHVPVPPPGAFTGAGTPYGLAVLEKQLAILRAAKKGERNTRLNRCAFIIAKHVASGHLDEGSARAQLWAAAVSIGLADWETARTIGSAFDSVMGLFLR